MLSKKPQMPSKIGKKREKGKGRDKWKELGKIEMEKEMGGGMEKKKKRKKRIRKGERKQSTTCNLRFLLGLKQNWRRRKSLTEFTSRGRGKRKLRRSTKRCSEGRKGIVIFFLPSFPPPILHSHKSSIQRG